MSATKKGIGIEVVCHVLEDGARRTTKRLTGYTANYGDATIEDVPQAMLMRNRVLFKPSRKGKA